jgi:hypothetical protein
MNHIYHVCKSGQQRPGRREDCERCSPKPSKDAIIVRQAAQIAYLKNLLAELHDGRGQINYDSVIWKEVGDAVGRVTS